MWAELEYLVGNNGMIGEEGCVCPESGALTLVRGLAFIWKTTKLSVSVLLTKVLVKKEMVC